jgi:hypothetical protein
MDKHKICTKCSFKKHRDMFPNKSKNKDGKDTQCRICIKNSRAKHYKKTKELIQNIVKNSSSINIS